jgi:hypothetical protein
MIANDCLKKFAERRRYPRIKISNRILYLLFGQEGQEAGEQLGIALNVSQTGILIEIHQPVAGKFLLLASENPEGALVEIVGKVMFCQQVEDGKYRVGINFQGDRQDNVAFRRDLIRVFHKKTLLGSGN